MLDASTLLTACISLLCAVAIALCVKGSKRVADTTALNAAAASGDTDHGAIPAATSRAFVPAKGALLCQTVASSRHQSSINAYQGLQSGDLDTAVEVLTQVISLNSSDYKARATRSAVLLAKFSEMSESSNEIELAAAAGFLTRAIQDAEVCIQMDRMLPEGYLCKINVLRSIEENREALLVCKYARGLLPSCPQLRQALSELENERRPAPKCCSHGHSHDHSHSHSRCGAADQLEAAVTERSARETGAPYRPSCSFCDTERQPLSLCGGCQLVHYCSRQCQLADRKTHKLSCKAAIEAMGSTST